MEENNNVNTEVPVVEENAVNVEQPVTEVTNDTQVANDMVVEQPIEVVANVDNQVQLSTPEVQTIDGFSNVSVASVQEQEIPVQPEFASVDVPVQATPEVVGTPLKPKKKVNKTLIVVLIFVVIFGGVMLLMSQGDKGSVNNGNNKEEEINEIKVNVGTEWGDKYLAYMMEKKPELKNYEISFIDTNADDIPEMFIKYKDNSDKEAMKILYIADDGYVYESKYYRDYRIRYIYSLKDKTISWYLFLTTTKHYGSYTMISKIIDDMAFDADIKASNDAQLIEYGKKYYDTDYNVVFFSIKENSHEDDFKEFVSRYQKYVDEIAKLDETIKEKYKDYEYKEEVKENNNTIGLVGRIFNYGTYLANIEANPDKKIEAHIAVIVLYRDGTISVDGKLHEYTIQTEDSLLVLDNSVVIDIYNSNEFMYNGILYKYVEK